MAKLIKASGEQVDVSPKTGEKFSLEELQAHVGGYVEPLYLGEGKVVLVDEDGQLKKRPINEFVSRMIGRLIVGDVLFGTQKELDV